MGDVYRARDTRLNRTVALKVVQPARTTSVSSFSVASGEDDLVSHAADWAPNHRNRRFSMAKRLSRHCYTACACSSGC